MVYLSPAGLAAAPTANTLALTATFKEKLCKTVCAISSNQPSATVSYTNETPLLRGTTVFVPVVARITITTPECGCAANTQTITERFMAAFQGQTALPTSVTINQEGEFQGLIKVVCGKSNCYAITDSLLITITPPAAA